MSPLRSRWGVAAVAAALLAGALTAWATDPGTPSTPGPSSVALPTSSGPVQPPVTTGSLEPLIPSPSRSTSTVPIAPPTRLEIPAIGVRMPLTPVALDRRGDMELPPSPKVAGWYRYGPAPGADSGAVVLAAHVDTPREGVGPLAALEELKPGSSVVVRSGTQRRLYRITSVTRLDKGRLDLASLFARDGPARLHIVTCGGEFDRRTRQYADNVVAVALPVS